MQLEVRVFGGLEEFIPGVRFGQPINIERSEGSTVGELLDSLRIPRKQVLGALINGRYAAMDTVLQPGDRVALFPPVGGG